jgi:enoyl-[acyl-carrier-protein] reductase (NADH)
MLTSGSGGPQVATPPDVWPMGGTGPADAATETFMRYLAAEVGPRGVRVVSLWTAGVKDTSPSDARTNEEPFEATKERLISSASMLRRRPALQEVADTATFLASDRGSGITAATVNVSSGLTAN